MDAAAKGAQEEAKRKAAERNKKESDSKTEKAVKACLYGAQSRLCNSF